MTQTNYTLSKEDVLGAIPLEDEVRLFFEIDASRGKAIAEQLRSYGKVLYEDFSRLGYLGIKIEEPKKVVDLIERLYSRGIEGVLDLEVDSRSVSFDSK